MSARITLRQVAEAARISLAGASMALRDCPNISPATRQRVQELARKMGYRPDPALSIIAAHRWRAREGFSGVVLAYLVQAYPGSPAQRIFNSLQPAAERHGYHIEMFDRVQSGGDTELSRLLIKRGIRGVLCGPMPVDRPPPALDWDHFSVVSCGWKDPHCPFHSVESDYFASMELAWEEVWKLGYRRIGLATFLHEPPDVDDERRMGAVLWRLDRLRPSNLRIPPLTCHPLDRAAFLKWFNRHRPEAVIALHIPPLNWLRAAGWRVPQDAGFACLLGQRPPDCAGLVDAMDARAEAAIDLVDSELRHSRRGIPALARTVLIEPTWQPGPTLVARTASSG